jgi:hypothetical protein
MSFSCLNSVKRRVTVSREAPMSWPNLFVRECELLAILVRVAVAARAAGFEEEARQLRRGNPLRAPSATSVPAAEWAHTRRETPSFRPA